MASLLAEYDLLIQSCGVATWQKQFRHDGGLQNSLDVKYILHLLWLEWHS